MKSLISGLFVVIALIAFAEKAVAQQFGGYKDRGAYLTATGQNPNYWPTPRGNTAGAVLTQRGLNPNYRPVPNFSNNFGARATQLGLNPNYRLVPSFQNVWRPNPNYRASGLIPSRVGNIINGWRAFGF